jgi:hypothetical protein
MKIILSLILYTSLSFAQNVYEIPFASSGNTIELSVVNKSIVATEQVTVTVSQAPAWLKFKQSTFTVASVKAKVERTATFEFSVEKSAEVQKEQTISLLIKNSNGEQWTKDIKISVAAPETFELFQNYPNPFNPATIIGYQLPGVGTQYIVSLRIYDVIGREIINLTNERQEAGYHEVKFNAQNLASGMYVYQLIATDGKDSKHIFRKKMTLLR